MERGEVENRERMVNTEGSVYYNSSKIMIKIDKNKSLISFELVLWNPPNNLRNFKQPNAQIGPLL